MHCAIGRWLSLSLLALAGCDPFYECAGPRARELEALPLLLSETGLYHEGALAQGVRPYRPRFELWSDGAEKRRFLFLPPGARIDARAADSWRFPEGTKVWKEFSRDGVKLETRLVQKIGPGERDWSALSYLWRADQSDAEAVPHGAMDVLGTSHDVPAAGECWACHGPRESFVLGVSYVQLGYAAEDDLLDVARLTAGGQIDGSLSPLLALPGGESVQAGLGYLHANCGHCHNSDRASHGAGSRCYDPQNDLDFWLRSDRLARVEETPTVRSARAALSPDRPSRSRVLQAMKRRGLFGQMPPLASERVDQVGVDAVRSFIEALP